MFQKYFCLLVLILFSNTLFSQKITGKVYSGSETIIGAHIQVKNHNIIETTNENGFFQISLPKKGVYFLKISAIGHETIEQKIVLNSDSLNINFDIPENVSALNEVVISGTLQEVSKLHSAVNVEIITPKLFQKNPSNNLFESLNMVNGVRPQINCSVCNTGDIHINGLEGAYTMVLIDGMPIVSSLSTVYGLSGIPNSMIERIEVVKGPNSSIYGSEAVAGIINIITKQPEKMPFISTDIMATGLGDVNYDFALKQKINKANVMLSANYFHYDKPIDNNNDNFTDVTLQKRLSVFNKWSFQRKENRLASVGIRFLNENRWGGEMQFNDSFRGTDLVYGESILTNRAELIGQYQLPIHNEKVMFSFSANTHLQDSYYGVTPFKAKQNVLFGQLTWAKKLNLRNSLLSGVNIRHTLYTDNTPITNGYVQNSILPGVFIQNESVITEKHTILSGLRADYHHLHGFIFSPRINYKWQTDKLSTFRIGVGNGFRVVNIFTEDHAALTGSRNVIISKDINPEKSVNATLNYNRFVNFSNGFLNIDASVFYTYFNNKIIPDYTTDYNAIIYNNINGYAISRGFSLANEFSFVNGFKALAGITFLDVFSYHQNVHAKQVFVSPFSGNFTISYKVKNIVFDYTGNIYSPMLLPVVENDFRDEQSPWYSIQNLQITLPLKYKKHDLELYGGIKNLLNFLPSHPILRANDPFDRNIHVDNPNNYSFDVSYMYAPLQPRRLFLGIRMNLK
jgi:outer membrane receptor for ferrienterochelin and colicins